MTISPALMRIIDAKKRDPRLDYVSRDANGKTKAERIIARGEFIPHGAKLLVRCIWPHDASTLDAAGYDAKTALAFEVLAIGYGCYHWYEEREIPMDGRVSMGDHVQCSIATVDRAVKDDASTAFYTIPVEWVDAFWSPDEPEADAPTSINAGLDKF